MKPLWSRFTTYDFRVGEWGIPDSELCVAGGPYYISYEQDRSPLRALHGRWFGYSAPLDKRKKLLSVRIHHNKVGLDRFRGTYTTIDLFCAAIKLRAGFTSGVVHAFIDRIGRIWIFFKLRDLEEMQNLLTKFYLAFLESLSSASLCSTQKLIEADGSSNVCLSTAQPYVVGRLHELSSSCDDKNTRLLPSLSVSQRTRQKEYQMTQRAIISDSGKVRSQSIHWSAAFQNMFLPSVQNVRHSMLKEDVDSLIKLKAGIVFSKVDGIVSPSWFGKKMAQRFYDPLQHQWYMAEQEERLPMIEYMDLAKQGVGADYFANNDLENNFTISDVGADEQMNRTLPWLSFTTKLNSVLKRVTTSKSEVNGG
ncbi:hypothetical protein Tco_0923546 [Tanacetum coccineum]|uniref:Uncharacterized protein n=1 Tax=Tanacetum coccineum TaxID=301880 RepID=A0ABQ5D2R9_9ASTR